MTREEAAEFTRKLLARAEINAFPSNLKRINNIPAFYFEAVLSVLLGPQPDPKTGLVPCGCGGKVETHELFGHYSGTYMTDCKECATGTTQYNTEKESKDAWNTAMGWRLKDDKPRKRSPYGLEPSHGTSRGGHR